MRKRDASMHGVFTIMMATSSIFRCSIAGVSAEAQNLGLPGLVRHRVATDVLARREAKKLYTYSDYR
jgi:hypothetical protein